MVLNLRKPVAVSMPQQVGMRWRLFFQTLLQAAGILCSAPVWWRSCHSSMRNPLSALLLSLMISNALPVIRVSTLI